MHSHAAEAEAALVTSLRAGDEGGFVQVVDLQAPRRHASHATTSGHRSPKAPYGKASYTKESALPRISHLGSQSCLRTFIGGKVAVPWRRETGRGVGATKPSSGIFPQAPGSMVAGEPVAHVLHERMQTDEMQRTRRTTHRIPGRLARFERPREARNAPVRVRRMRKLSHSIHIDDRNLESDPRGRLQAHAARYVIGALSPTAPLSFAGQPSSAQQQWIHQLCCRQRPSVFRWLAPTQPPLDRWSR